METLQPEGWPKPRGYANGIAARGRTVFVAGQVGWGSDGRFAAGFTAQFSLILANTLSVLAEIGAGPEHIARMTWYVLDLEEYKSALREIGAVYRDKMGRHYPAMSVIEVSGLVEPEARLEIETTAVLPD